MNSKLLRILVIALTTFLLSTPAFACGGAQKDKDIGNTNQGSQSYSTDRDMGNMNQGSYDNDKSMAPSDQSQNNQSDTSSDSESSSTY